MVSNDLFIWGRGDGGKGFSRKQVLSSKRENSKNFFVKGGGSKNEREREGVERGFAKRDKMVNGDDYFRIQKLEILDFLLFSRFFFSDGQFLFQFFELLI